MGPEDEEIELQNGVEIEGQEQDIMMQNELIAVGKVNSVNGKTGDVILTTSDLENDSDYQTGSEVESAISEAVAGKQDKLTAGDNITIENNVISASDTTYTAGNGLSLNNENEFSVDTTVVATQQNLATEVTNRENADNALQAQIDGIAASSDVVDIVGTYAELQSYDTQHLKDNDIIKVLQDETQNNATTYYRWSTATESFTLIGQEGPYYTKAAADAQFVPQTRTVNSKALSSNITLTASDVSAVASSDVVQVTGSNTTKIMSQKATTDALGLKLNISDYVIEDALANSTNPVQNKVLYGLFGSMPSDFFTGPVTVNGNGRDITLTGTMNAKLSDVKMYGDTFQQTYSGKNLYDATTAEATSSGLTYSANNSQIYLNGNRTGARINFKWMTLPAGTYKFMAELVSGSISTTSTGALFYFDGSGVTTSPAQVYLKDDNKRVSMTVTIPSTASCVVYIYPRASETFTNAVVKYQLVASSTEDWNFEPYVGGTASPNPDYPQDVQTVTGEQTVTVTGKNLCDGINQDYWLTSNAANAGVTTGNSGLIMTVKPNTTYTVSTTVSQARYRIALSDQTYQGSNFTVYDGVVKDGTSQSITINSSTHLYLIVNATDLTKIQVEKGSATAYEPYQGATYTVDLGATELCKIGNYQDYIYKSGDDWYVHKEIDSGTLTGTTADMNVSQQPGTGRFNIVLPTSWTVYKHQANSILAFCNSYQLVGQSEYNSGFDNVVTNMSYALNFNSGGGNALRVKNIDASTVQEMKDSMTATPLVLYYALATPADTKITNADLISDLNALWNALSYDGQTNFAITASGLSGILDVTAFKKTLAGLIDYINR